MKPQNILFALLSSVFFAMPVFSTELDSALSRTAQKLSRMAIEKGLSASTLAVFPFQADEKLSKKRVNLAVSEMLTRNLLLSGTFKLTERDQLEEVLREQKLALSGALDSKTAANVGRLIGAKLLVLGNVIQVGNSYQITSKLVNSDTGEIVASEMNEVPIKIFDEDAERYLVLVPKYQAIGLYLVSGYLPITRKKLPEASNGSYTVTPLNPGADSTYIGGGVRYFLSPEWMLDASIAIIEYNDSHLYPNDFKSSAIQGTMTRLSIDRVFGLSEKFKVHAGIGTMSMSVSPVTSGTTFQTSIPPHATYTTPLARVGLEWKPQARLGLGVFGQYNVLKDDYKIKGYGVLVRQFTFPQLIVETTLSLYF